MVDLNYQGSVTNTLAIGRETISATLASTNNPSGYRSGTGFTATLPGDATGTVIFRSAGGGISTNYLSGGVAASQTVTNLPRGTNVISVEYSGDLNHTASTNTLEQLVTNHPPAAAVYNLSYTPGLRLHVFLANLATNWSDADGDPVALAGVRMVSTNGVNLLTNSTQILYVNPAKVNDRIDYQISDGYGGTNSGIINLVVNPFVIGVQTPATVTAGVDQLTVAFYGIPSFVYSVQRSTNLSNSLGWTSISTNTTGANGLIQVTDTFPDLGGNMPAAAYYRLLWQP